MASLTSPLPDDIDSELLVFRSIRLRFEPLETANWSIGLLIGADWKQRKVGRAVRPTRKHALLEPGAQSEVHFKWESRAKDTRRDVV